jgi:hypothetical protein
VQTFLPYPSFAASAACLDKRRALKQVVEAKQIIDVLEGTTQGWKNHPAVKMWAGFVPALTQYYNAFFVHCEAVHKINFNKLKYKEPPLNVKMPEWLYESRFCASHRSNLLRKKPEYYGQFGWIEPNNLEYWWPTKN